MTSAQADLRALFSALVAQRCATGDWHFVAVSRVDTLPRALRLGLQALVGGPLPDGVLVLLERAPEVEGVAGDA